jgi:hypothetical protein
MRHYAAFIASTDNYTGTAEDLPSQWQNDNEAVHIYDFEVPPSATNEVILLIARGIFWEAGWAQDGTVHTVVEDITDVNEKDEVNLDHLSEALNPLDEFAKQVEIRKTQAATGTTMDVTFKGDDLPKKEMSEAQSHDPFSLSEDDDVTGYPV